MPGIKNSLSISSLGVFLDHLQQKHGVIFIVASGNRNNEENNELISAPSGSFLVLFIGAVDSNYSSTSYSKKGYGQYVTSKPDLAIFGGDKMMKF